MVEAQNRQAVERDLVDEGEKTFDQAIHSLIEIHMLAVDVGDHGDGGRKEQKRAIALIGLSPEFPLVPTWRCFPTILLFPRSPWWDPVRRRSERQRSSTSWWSCRGVRARPPPIFCAA